MIIKSLGLSQLIYQESVLYVPEGIAPVVKTKLERPLEKQERQNQKSSFISRPAERWDLYGRYWNPFQGSKTSLDSKSPEYYPWKLGALNIL